MIYIFSKRIFDVLISVLFLLFLSPLYLIISFLVFIDSGFPIFYSGKRAGLNNVAFYVYKFRTMVINSESIGGFSTALNDPRLTKLGKLLRKTKLDELPQFFNVLIGNMSLVGPRPQVLFYTNQYHGDEKLILSVKPGITDLASIYFSNMDKILGDGDVAAKYQAEIEPVKNILRIQYVRTRSFALDIRILLETFFGLLGISNITNLNISKYVAK